MTNEEIDKILDRMAGLWPSWQNKANDEQVQEWRGVLMFLNYKNVYDACTEIWQTQRWVPTPEKLRMKAKELKYRSPEEQKRRDERAQAGYSGYWLLCVEGPEAFPRRGGWYVPVMWPRAADVPPPDKVARLAEQMRAAYEAFYGGQWQTYQADCHDAIQEVAQRFIPDLPPEDDDEEPPTEPPPPPEDDGDDDDGNVPGDYDPFFDDADAEAELVPAGAAEGDEIPF